MPRELLRQEVVVVAALLLAVLAGWTAGLAWSVACRLVARYLQRRATIEETG